MVPATTVAQEPYLLEERGKTSLFDVAASQTYLISPVCHLSVSLLIDSGGVLSLPQTAALQRGWGQ